MAYIYQHSDWANFYWSDASLLQLLGQVRHTQGRLIGRMNSLGFDLIQEAQLETITANILKTNEIEGEILNTEEVRSSVARRLGLEIAGLIPSDRYIDGVVEMSMEAIENFDKPLTETRLFGWHNALFPTGYSGVYKILVAQWRADRKGRMQVVSGTVGNEKIHFEAPEAAKIPSEMAKFLGWFNQKTDIDLLLKAAITHLWFVTLHPFEDGNGRIARAITDMVLAQSDAQKQRFYSMSAQIQQERKSYYAILEQTQKGNLDITEWLVWFLNCLQKALEGSEARLEKVIFKHYFWQKNTSKIRNERQKKVVNLLLNDFKGHLTTEKWAKIGKCSQDTALRDIQDLIDQKILLKQGTGRSTYYILLE